MSLNFTEQLVRDKASLAMVMQLNWTVSIERLEFTTLLKLRVQRCLKGYSL